MRRGNEILQFQKRGLRVRLGLEYIEGGAGNLSAFQRRV